MNRKLKVSTVALPPFLMLVVVSLVGLINLREIVRQLKHVSEADIPLTAVLHEVEARTLEQEIWFERALRAGEKASAGELASASSEFSRLGSIVEAQIAEARRIVKAASSDRRNDRSFADEMTAIMEQLQRIETAHTTYMRHALEVFQLFEQKTAPAAGQAVTTVRLDELGLNEALKDIRTRIERFTADSVQQALRREIRAAVVMTIGLSVFVLIVLIAFPLLMLLW